MRTSLVPWLLVAVIWLASVPAAALAHTPVAAPQIAWRACAVPQLPTRECGELAVPLDYDQPAGPQITLALARVPATDPAARIGSLLTNPGGPGGSGVDGLAYTYPPLDPAIQARFDVIGIDPRGVGQSSPVHCFASVPERTAFFAAIPSVPVGAEQEAAREAAARDLAQRCGERNADLLPHLSTANVARDLDMVRQAVGDEQTTYLGSSYGTYLGATYANLFPDRLRAMVLDGVIDPAAYANADASAGDVTGPATSSFLRILSNQGSALALDDFFARCAAAGPVTCPFAEADAAATRAKFDALLARLREAPAVVEGPAGRLTVSASLVVETARGAMYAAPLWAGLGEGLQRLEEGDAAGFLIATGNLGGPPPTTYHNTQEATPASNCVDADNPRDPALFRQMVDEAEARTPVMGAVWAYLSQPCLFWPAVDADRYTGPWDTPTSATILLISRVYDPATPHASAQSAERTLGNARLLTIDGWGHSYFEGGRSTCADAAMARYLVDLVLPEPGAVCAEDAPPFASGASEVPAVSGTPMADAPDAG